MSLHVSIGVVALLVTSRAMADRLVDVEMVNGARFAGAEVTAALRIRVGLSGPPIALTIISIGDGDQVIIELGHVRRTVALGGRTGEDAARLVALAASDLVLGDLATVPPPTPRAHWTIDALGTVAAWDHPVTGGVVDLTIPRGSWLVLASLGGGVMVDGPVQVDAEVVRLGVGRRIGRFDLGIHATVVPIEVPTGDGDVTALVGGGAMARVRLPIGDAAALVVAAGVDAFATQTQYALAHVNVEVTPWIAPWLAVGLELAP